MINYYIANIKARNPCTGMNYESICKATVSHAYISKRVYILERDSIQQSYYIKETNPRRMR